MLHVYILAFVLAALLTLLFTKPEKEALKSVFKKLMRNHVKIPENGHWVVKALKIGYLEAMISEKNMVYFINDYAFFYIGRVFAKEDAFRAPVWRIKPREEFIGIFGQWKHMRSVGMAESFSKKT